jgi:hypothetical protein
MNYGIFRILGSCEGFPGSTDAPGDDYVICLIGWSGIIGEGGGRVLG